MRLAGGDPSNPSIRDDPQPVTNPNNATRDPQIPRPQLCKFSTSSVRDLVGSARAAGARARLRAAGKPLMDASGAAGRPCGVPRPVSQALVSTREAEHVPRHDPVLLRSGFHGHLPDSVAAVRTPAVASSQRRAAVGSGRWVALRRRPVPAGRADRDGVIAGSRRADHSGRCGAGRGGLQTSASGRDSARSSRCERLPLISG